MRKNKYTNLYKMKFISRFLLFTAAAAGLCNVSCSEDPALGGAASGEDWVDFELTKSEIESRASIQDDGSGSFTEGDIVDLYARSTSGEEHLQLTLQNGEWTPKVRRNQLGTGEVTLTAYYPVGTNKAAGSYSHAVEADQSSNEGFAASDLLRSSTTLRNGEKRATLLFDHAMHRVKIVVTPENGATLPEDLQVEVRSRLAGSIDEAGTATVDTSAETQWIKARKSGEGCWEAILFPQATEEYKSSWIRLTTGTKRAEYKLPEQIGGQPFTRLEGGKQVTVNLKLKSNGEGGGDGSGDGERPEGTFKLSFDANGGSGSIEPKYVKPGENIYLPDGKELSRDNATFAGWSKTPDVLKIDYPNGFIFTMGNENITLYAAWNIIGGDVGGACEEFKGKTKWVHGITPPQPGEWKEVVGWDPKEHGRSVPWLKGLGWYDTDQFLYNLCWAAGASNVIHWWLDQNKKYIDRHGYNGPKDYTTEPRSSKIFDYFRTHWPNQGNSATAGFTWFITGESDYGMIQGGGFFKEVFLKDNLTIARTDLGGIQQRPFNEMITTAIKNHRAITLAEPSIGILHQYTVWGVEYDNEGYVCAYYYTNSNDSDIHFKDKVNGRNQPIGMLRGKIVYENGRTYVVGLGSNIPIAKLETYSLGTEQWDAYFKAHPGKKQEK